MWHGHCAGRPTKEHDGCAGRSDGRERAAALGMAIELGHDHATEVDGLLERCGLVTCTAERNGIELHSPQRATHTIARLTALLTSGLADRCIQDEDGEVRADGLLDSNHLFE